MRLQQRQVGEQQQTLTDALVPDRVDDDKLLQAQEEVPYDFDKKGSLSAVMTDIAG